MNDDNKEGEAEYGLVVSFAGQPPEFVYGFELGGIWHRMQSGQEAEIKTTTHTYNREILQRMATADGWDCNITASEVEGWDYTELTKTKRLDRPNPHGLRVI